MTNNYHRRLKQHNREMKGGAWATETRGPYHHVCILTGWFDKSQCHEGELALKRITKRTTKYSGPLGRVRSVAEGFKTLTHWAKNKNGVPIKDCQYEIQVLPKYVPGLKEIKEYPNVTIKHLEDEFMAPVDETDKDAEALY